jgi:predicted deoxyguanosinetriphosphate triphosphohydrolase
MSKDYELEGYALDPKKRKKDLKDSFREYETKEREDEFRTAYHRDRDRIVWSNAFRRLQNKTQVFAHDDEDHYRRRLTHSIEVAAIACAIVRRLGLNEVVTDAIALGHDIGHTPFGHAGEEALNEILTEENRFPEEITQCVPLKGFDHCAHAIEIICRIETLNGIYPGLDLSFDIRDGILKHIYHQKREADALVEKPFSALSEIVKCNAYEQYRCNYGSLEAQCVWFADKLTYLFDDTEDAIRAKIFKFDIIKQRKMLEKLMAMAKKLGCNNGSSSKTKRIIRGVMKPLECDIIKSALDSNLANILGKKFKDHYRENGMKDLYKKSDKIQKNHPDDDVRQFLFWRNKVMTVMIGDCVKATTGRIKNNSIKNVQDVLDCSVRLVDISDDLGNAWRDSDASFYKKAMLEILFKHPIVLRHTYNAKQKVHRLFELYEKRFDLIPEDYRDNTKENYKNCRFCNNEKENDDVIETITIINYIAGFTDAYVNQKLQEYIT